MEQGAQIYYIKPAYHLSQQHRMHISDAMYRMYAKKGGRRTPEERKHISNGMKKYWAYYKAYWTEHEGS